MKLHSTLATHDATLKIYNVDIECEVIDLCSQTWSSISNNLEIMMVIRFNIRQV